MARNIKRVFQVLLLLLVLSFVLWRVLLHHEIKNRFAQIRAAGLPASAAELNTWRRPIPDHENGALVLTQAFGLLPEISGKDFRTLNGPELLARTNQWSAATRELVQTYVSTNAAALAKAREALQFPRFQYPLDFSYGVDTDMRHLGKLRQAGRVVALQSALQADDNQPDAWPEQIELALKLAGTLNEEPALTSYLVRAAMISTATKAAERNLNRNTPASAACQRMQAAFAQAGATNLLPLALVGERALFIPQFRLSWKEIKNASRDDQGENPPERVRSSGKPSTGLWLTGFFERDLNFYLQTMETGIAQSQLPVPESFALTNHMETASTTARKRLYVMSGLLLPALGRIVMREAATQAGIRLTTTALAVERFRQQQGKLPRDLQELTPQFLASVPMDPFTGKPLQYRPLPRGYILYSVGADGQDDGGREPPVKKKSSDQSTYDLTFIVER